MVDWGRVSVLVVDDFAPMLTIVQKMLSELGVRDIDRASSCDAALARLRSRDYDLLIVDYFLGDETGDELIARARAAGEDVTAVIMTGEPERASRALGHEVDWLRKPFTAAELQLRIEATLP